MRSGPQTAGASLSPTMSFFLQATSKLQYCKLEYMNPEKPVPTHEIETKVSALRPEDTEI